MRINCSSSLVLIFGLQFFTWQSVAFSKSTLLQQCWSESELTGTATDLEEKPMPAGPRNPKYKNLPRSKAAAEQGIVAGVTLDKKKLVALTFDICEISSRTYGYDYRIIDLLRAEAVPATLFISGHWMWTHPERIQQLIVDPLFEIANHSWSHPDFDKISSNELERQVLWAEKAYVDAQSSLLKRKCVGETKRSDLKPMSKLFRFPIGHCREPQIAAVEKLGYRVVHWNLPSGDPDPSIKPARMAKVLIEQAKPGSIIIGHANGRGLHLPEALKIVISKLRDQGFEFVTVSNLLKSGPAKTETSCEAKTFSAYTEVVK